GRAPWPSGLPLATLARAALSRERAMQRLRYHPPRPWHLVSVHRLPPPALQRRHGERARAAILGGALLQLTRTNPGMRVLDQAAEAAGGIVPVGVFTAGSGGCILSRLPASAPVCRPTRDLRSRRPRTSGESSPPFRATRGCWRRFPVSFGRCSARSLASHGTATCGQGTS